MMATFNLIDEPWIPVLTLNGEQRLVGIRDCLRGSQGFTGIAAELPTVSIAIQRLLQAVLLRAAGDLTETNEARARLWGTWWRAGQFPQDLVDAYLDRWHDRFDLFDETAPFFQVPGLALPSGGGSGLVKIMADVPAGTKFFVTRAGTSTDRISFAEAAQWLVHAQAFDCAGIKSGVIDDARVKGGKSYSFGYPAWSGNLGIISVEGNDLAQTLLFNLTLTATSHDDAPQWEVGPQRIASDAVYPIPRGAAQAWTWPSRMIRLIEWDGFVADVVLSNGERLGPQNRFGEEPMTSWRFSKLQSSKLKQDVYMPVLHNPEHAAWRGLAGILAVGEEGATAMPRPSAGLEWLALLENEGELLGRTRGRLRCVGMTYGSRASSYDRDFDDIVPATVGLLATASLRRVAVEGVATARAGVLCLRDFARNIALAAGDSGDGVDKKIAALEAVAYDRLRPLFDSWIVTLIPGVPSDRCAGEWQRVVLATLLEVSSEYARMAPTTAAVGRRVKLRNKEAQMDVGMAGIWLRAGLGRALPLAQRGAESKEGHDGAKTQ